ncbi:MAG: hypothetical protein HKUEN07_27780 [Rhodocyclaceae bacterium]|uniref:Uncharacterized protein n=1 Tax=Candidatus Desulfobacillus denitrificans TaxID=2608985 RepID=A0A809RT69_9PROT|nr:hypothetical protein DSYM_03460 [Candidatus Desulfobacillus denitrificans]GIK45675.1 MAG: hypothetical protein BroJett012_15780 [Betaproteobacteria bacterium]GJQ56209.1 MAG: hypothetical protein HKUEN07_27780 [Rhodocyclaceae bacterium]
MRLGEVVGTPALDVFPARFLQRLRRRLWRCDCRAHRADRTGALRFGYRRGSRQLGTAGKYKQDAQHGRELAR